MYQEQRNRTFSPPTFTTSSSRNPASHRSHSEAALADPGSALRLGSFFEKCGVKNACSVVVVFFFLVEISGLATRLILVSEVTGVQCFL